MALQNFLVNKPLYAKSQISTDSEMTWLPHYNKYFTLLTRNIKTHALSRKCSLLLCVFCHKVANKQAATWIRCNGESTAAHRHRPLSKFNLRGRGRLERAHFLFVNVPYCVSSFSKISIPCKERKKEGKSNHAGIRLYAELLSFDACRLYGCFIMTSQPTSRLQIFM